MNMKTEKKKSKIVVLILLLMVIVLCSATPAKSQQKNNNGKSSSASGGAHCFDAGTRILNIGLGLGGASYYSYGWGRDYHRSPAFSFSYEQALKEKVGPGYLGLGAYLGFQTASYRYDYTYYNNNNYYYQHRWNYWMLAARGAYHLDALNWEKGEIYFGTLIGLRIQTYRYSTNNPDPLYQNFQLHDRSVYPAWSLFAGGRYYFTPSVAGFLEIGYGISYATIGVSFKL